MNQQHASVNMIKQQVRTVDVTDERVLQAFDQIDRQRFVPHTYATLAYADMPIQLDHDQVMLPPNVQARMLQLLAIREQDKVLEIGTGTGYLTALLSQLCHHVYSVDIFPDFTQSAQSQLDTLNIDNASLLTEDAWQHPETLSIYAPFDVIISTCALYDTPQFLMDDLALGGRLLIILGQQPAMQVIMLTKQVDHSLHMKSAFETIAPYAVNLQPKSTFTL